MKIVTPNGPVDMTDSECQIVARVVCSAPPYDCMPDQTVDQFLTFVGPRIREQQKVWRILTKDLGEVIPLLKKIGYELSDVLSELSLRELVLTFQKCWADFKSQLAVL